ncbi:MAG: hypothetical protein HC922_10175 [Leptolyngbyaceae cyanobacterium SM2_3_12]|nr:hypothetical protein [Leptolyngbyaceae cyanobacterium SM2_3_12]
MLGHSLAILVGLGSVTLYLAAFFFPEIHRKHDFFWSGVGCFYALVLWFCAEQISPTEALGHGASLSLLGWLGWQTLTLRRKRTPLDLQTPVTEDSWRAFRRELIGLGQDFIRQTPLGRWLPISEQRGAVTPEGSGIEGELRASSLKDVGYEFLDELTADSPALTKSRIVAETNGTLSPSGRSQLAQPKRPTAIAKSFQPGPVPAGKPPKPMTWLARVKVFQSWVQDVVKSARAPKPKKPVIEIPPRPSSMVSRRNAPNPPAQSPNFQDGSLSQDFDLALNQPPAINTINIVDTQVVESAEAPEKETESEN